jgi:hypothetical protein
MVRRMAGGGRGGLRPWCGSTWPAVAWSGDPAVVWQCWGCLGGALGGEDVAQASLEGEVELRSGNRAVTAMETGGAGGSGRWQRRCCDSVQARARACTQRGWGRGWPYGMAWPAGPLHAPVRAVARRAAARGLLWGAWARRTGPRVRRRVHNASGPPRRCRGVRTSGCAGLDAWLEGC